MLCPLLGNYTDPIMNFREVKMPDIRDKPIVSRHVKKIEILNELNIEFFLRKNFIFSDIIKPGRLLLVCYELT